MLRMSHHGQSRSRGCWKRASQATKPPSSTSSLMICTRTFSPKPPLGLEITRISDYAFTRDDRNARAKELFKKVRGKQADSGVTTSPSSRNSFLFGSIETTSASGDSVEAYTQSIFLCALLKRYSTFMTEVPPPLLGIITVGHQWLIYIPWLDMTGTVHIHGPIEIVECSTRTYHGIFKTLDLLRRVRMYGEEVVLPWLERVTWWCQYLSFPVPLLVYLYTPANKTNPLVFYICETLPPEP